MKTSFNILSWRRRYLNRQEIAKKLQEIEEQRRQRNLAIKKGLPAQALRQQRQEQYELSALLARQAYLFNQRDQCEVLDQVDEALREVLSIVDLCSLLRDHQTGVLCVAFDPDSYLLASGSWDGTILLWDLHNLNQKPVVLNEHTKRVNTIAFTPPQPFLLSGLVIDHDNGVFRGDRVTSIRRSSSLRSCLIERIGGDLVILLFDEICSHL